MQYNLKLVAGQKIILTTLYNFSQWAVKNSTRYVISATLITVFKVKL